MFLIFPLILVVGIPAAIIGVAWSVIEEAFDYGHAMFHLWDGYREKKEKEDGQKENGESP